MAWSKKKQARTLAELNLLRDTKVKAAYEAMGPDFASVRAAALGLGKPSKKVARDALRRAVEAGRASGKPVAYDPKRRGRTKLGLR